MSKDWAQGAADTASQLLDRILAGPAMSMLVSKEGPALAQYASPAPDPALIRSLADQCNAAAPQTKRYNGIHVNNADVAYFMKAFTLGTALSAEAAPWAQEVQFTIRPKLSRGLAAFHHFENAIILTPPAILEYCKLKKEGKNLSIGGYENVNPGEFPFILGAEEARHASQHLNEALTRETADKILQYQIDLAIERVQRLKMPQELEREIARTKELFGGDPHKNVASFSDNSWMIPYEENPIEVEAKKFVNSLRTQFASVAAQLEKGARMV